MGPGPDRHRPRNSKWDRIFKNYDYISEYAKSRYSTWIVEASCEPLTGKIRLRLVWEIHPAAEAVPV